jgi:cell division protein FtsB
MVDFSAVSTVATSLRTAADLARGFFGLAVTAEAQIQVAQLNQTILDAQRQAMDDLEERQELRRRVVDLEAEIRSLKDQKAAIAKLTRRGAFYFAPNDQDPLCSRCVEEHSRLIHMIVDSKQPTGIRHWLCPSCQVTFWEQR